MLSAPLLSLSLPALTLASIPILDPSDTISPLSWTADNAIVPNYNVPFISTQPRPLTSAYTFSRNTTSISHASFSTSLNDTSVLLATNGASLNLSHVEILKSGYASNLLEASFYGFNAAVNIVSLLFLP
jgi:hypothetical protein